MLVMGADQSCCQHETDGVVAEVIESKIVKNGGSSDIDPMDQTNQLEIAPDISSGHHRPPGEEDYVFESPLDSITRKIDQLRHLEPDHEIMRGIHLHLALQKKEFFTSPDLIRLTHRSDKVWNASTPVSSFDVFLSHTWRCNGRWKVVALVLQSGYSHGLIGWFLGVTLMLCLRGFDIVGDPWAAKVIMFGTEFTVGVSPWCGIAGGISLMLGLCLSPYLPLKTYMCFLDVACIHQGRTELFERGIYSIGGCLSVAKELRVLYSPSYVSSLWCIFELVGFRKANPAGKLSFKPLFIERSAMICAFITWVMALVQSASMAYTDSDFRQDNVLLVYLGVMLLPITLMVQALRHNYREKSQLISDLKSFDLDRVTCVSEFDHRFILTAIDAWYGNKEAFRDFVRGPLRDELLGLLPSPHLPPAYVALILSSAMATLLGFALNVYKAGAEIHQLVIFCVSEGTGVAVGS